MNEIEKQSANEIAERYYFLKEAAFSARSNNFLKEQIEKEDLNFDKVKIEYECFSKRGHELSRDLKIMEDKYSYNNMERKAAKDMMAETIAQNLILFNVKNDPEKKSQITEEEKKYKYLKSHLQDFIIRKHKPFLKDQ